MPDQQPATLYRFGVFELDTAKGELRRRGLRVKLHAQPFQILAMLLERPTDILTRDEIARVLWPDGTFVDFDHGVNSAINRLRDALGDKASNPRFVETLARRGYRWLVPVERVPALNSPSTQAAATPAPIPIPDPTASFLDRVLASEQDLPHSSPSVVQTLFLLPQVMYLGFYIGALANLAEINDLLSPLPHPAYAFVLLIATAALLIPVRTFLCFAVLFRAPDLREISQALALAPTTGPPLVARPLSPPAPHQRWRRSRLHDLPGLFALRPAVARPHGCRKRANVTISEISAHQSAPCILPQ